MTKPVSENQPLTWFERHENTLAKTAVILSLAVFFIGMGAMTAALATPSSSNFQYSFDSPLGQAQDVPTVTAIITGEGFGPVGIIFIITSSACLYRVSKKEKNKTVEKTTRDEALSNASNTKWRNLTKLIGLIILLFGVGMIGSSSLILDHSVSVLKTQAEYNKYVDEWVTSSEKMMAGMATIGTFMTIGGGALILGMDGFAKLRSWIQKHREQESENSHVTSLSEEL